MNRLHKLIKCQLRMFLANPLFYISAAIFVIFTYSNYFIKLQFFTGSGTSDLLSFFTSVPYISIIIIPALCYKTSFTIYDSFLPYSRFQKIIAQFSYIFICYLILILLLLPGVFIVNVCGQVDFGQVFASFFVLLFYGSAVISLCILLQNICNSGILSYVISAVILAIINSSHLFLVYISNAGILQEITKIISFAWHFDSASKGIIDTRDITFFTGISFLAIFANFLIKEKKAGKLWIGIFQRRNVLIMLVSVLFIMNGNRWYLRIDLSTNKTFSLSKYTKNLTSQIERPVKVTYYRSSSLNKLYPQVRDVQDFLISYSAMNNKIHFQIKDPDHENLSELLESYGIYSQQLRSVTNTSTEFTNVYSAIVVEYDGNSEIIPFVMSAQTLEYDMDGRLLHLITGAERNVNIIIGNDMSLSQDYNYVVPYLTAQGFICKQFFIQDPFFTQQLQEVSGPLLIIGDENINIENAIAIENYILQNKGNVLFTITPFNSRIEDDWSMHLNKNCNLIDMLENWGIKFTDQIVADLSCARITMYSQENTTTTKNINYPLWISVLPQKNCSSGITEFWPVSLQIENENIVEPLVYSSNYAYSYVIDRYNKESLIQTNPFILEQTPYMPSDEQQHTYILGAKIHGKLHGLYNDFESENDVNAIVIPDQYFVNSLMNEYIGGEYGDYRNFDYLTTLLLQLNNEYELSALQSRNSRDNTLYKIKDINQLQIIQKITYIWFIAIIPLLLLILYLIVGRMKNGKKSED